MLPSDRLMMVTFAGIRPSPACGTISLSHSSSSREGALGSFLEGRKAVCGEAR